MKKQYYKKTKKTIPQFLKKLNKINNKPARKNRKITQPRTTTKKAKKMIRQAGKNIYKLAKKIRITNKN
jgi:hypothetical protein